MFTGKPPIDVQLKHKQQPEKPLGAKLVRKLQSARKSEHDRV